MQRRSILAAAVLLAATAWGSLAYGQADPATSFFVPILDGDFTGDGNVNGGDFLEWQRTDVTPQGLTAWQQQYGTTNAAGVGNWNVPENWRNVVDPGPPEVIEPGVPADPQVPVIHAGRHAIVDTDNPAVNDLYIGDFDVGDVDGTVTLLNGGVLTVNDQMALSRGGGPDSVHGVLNQSGGELNAAVLFLAFSENNTAEYNLSGGAANFRDNLWFRAGQATMTQTGGDVDVGQWLILGELGNSESDSFYDMQGGTLNVTVDAFIGTAPFGDFNNSNGRMRISGNAVATFGGLAFGAAPGDQLEIADAGTLLVDNLFYFEADANDDIADGNIIGDNLTVTTDGGFTRITSGPPSIRAVPEPSTLVLVVAWAVAGTLVRGRR